MAGSRQKQDKLRAHGSAREVLSGLSQKCNAPARGRGAGV